MPRTPWIVGLSVLGRRAITPYTTPFGSPPISPRSPCRGCYGTMPNGREKTRRTSKQHRNDRPEFLNRPFLARARLRFTKISEYAAQALSPPRRTRPRAHLFRCRVPMSRESDMEESYETNDAVLYVINSRSGVPQCAARRHIAVSCRCLPPTHHVL
jgi:hypothetical protein